MRKLLLTAGVLAMSVATANATKPGENRGGNARAEQSQGRGHGGHGGRAENRRGGSDRAQRGSERRQERVAQREDRRENRAERRGNRGNEQRAQHRDDRQERRAERRGNRQDRGAERRDDRREMRADRRDNRIERRDDRRDRRDARVERRDDRIDRRIDRSQRRVDRRAVALRDMRDVQRLRFDRGDGLINGCPPGLARRNNGCMPPGQLRQQQRAWYNSWWDRRDSRDLYYDSGYLYRLAPSGAVAGFVPLLGGALWPGQAWPAQYEAYDVPDYYVDYYGFDDPYDYRLADGVIYGLDPETQAIQSVLALVTDNDWAIGQPMPDGYDVYNVPYDYRDQYADTADSWYRYDDGYVYQVDPTTQLIQAAIQLIT